MGSAIRLCQLKHKKRRNNQKTPKKFIFEYLDKLLALAGLARKRELKIAINTSRRLSHKCMQLREKNISISQKLEKLKRKVDDNESIRNQNDEHIRIIARTLYSFKSHKKNVSSYIELASMLYLSFRSHMGSYWSDSYQILNAGITNLFTAIIYYKGNKCFLKSTKAKQDAEFFFYSLILNKTLKQTGKFYAFATPLAIFEHEHARAYLFPFIDLKPVNCTHYIDNRAIRALAEMNSCNHSDNIRISTKLSRWNPVLKPTSIQEFCKCSLFGSKNAKQTALRRLKSILHKWNDVLIELHARQHSVTSHDLELYTRGMDDDKIIIVDMDRAAFYPIGSELFLQFHGNSRTIDVDILCGEYSAALQHFGISISVDELKFAASATAAWKWLGGNAEKLFSRKEENYIYGLESAEYCINSL